MNFPVYKKYNNRLSFFKITSEESFEELKIMGNHYSIITINAKILPERNFISDMLNNENGNWEESNEKEYENKMEECRRLKKLL